MLPPRKEGNAPQEEQSRKQVHKQLKVLDESLKSLATNVSILTTEMSSVLAEIIPVNVDSDKSDQKAKKSMVPLAVKIFELRERSDQIALNVESLRQRLEV